MKSRTSLILLAIAVIVLGLGWFFGPHATQAPQTSIAAGQLAFPGLAGKLQNAARITLTKDGKTLTIAHQGLIWAVSDQNGYAAQSEKVRSLLTGLTELRLVEPRTSDPALFSRLGLDDPEKPGSSSTLLQVLDSAGKPILALIIGHTRDRPQAGLAQEVYVRRPGENQTWLAEGRVDAQTDGGQWIDRQIANIDFKDIAHATVTQADGTQLEFAAKDGHAQLVKPAEHAPIEQNKLDDVFRAYEYLSFSDVKPVAEMPGKEVGSSVFTTTDGLTLNAVVKQDNNEAWASFSASGDGKVADRAAQFNAITKGWGYHLVTWKQQALAPTLQFLTTNTEVKTTPAPAEGAPAEAKPAAPPAGDAAPAK